MAVSCPTPPMATRSANAPFFMSHPKAAPKFPTPSFPAPTPMARSFPCASRSYAISDLKYGDLGKDIMISPRVAPAMIGLGLLQAVPDETLLALADPDDADGDGISGRPNEVWDSARRKKIIGPLRLESQPAQFAPAECRCRSRRHRHRHIDGRRAELHDCTNRLRECHQWRRAGNERRVSGQADTLHHDHRRSRPAQCK